MLLIFGITGDLATAMMFQSPYWLEQRNLLTWPILGAALDDWTVEQLAERARVSIVGLRLDIETWRSRAGLGSMS